jgi:hypothetical protein
MDFAPAAMALIDEEQRGAVKELFQAMTDFACKVVDKICEYWPMLAGFNIHDDWGAQKAPFFSEETAYELFVPFMRQLTDHIHSNGRYHYPLLRQCDHPVQCFIVDGFEADPQTMNEYTGSMKCTAKDSAWGLSGPLRPETNVRGRARSLARAFGTSSAGPASPPSSALGSYAMSPAFSEEVYVYSRRL